MTIKGFADFRYQFLLFQAFPNAMRRLFAFFRVNERKGNFSSIDRRQKSGSKSANSSSEYLRRNRPCVRSPLAIAITLRMARTSSGSLAREISVIPI
jgi:hypothetical protein